MDRAPHPVTTPHDPLQRDVYSFGQNSYGELAHGDTSERLLPTLVDSCRGKNVCQVAAGNEHSAVLTDSGAVYACGYNDSGQCGVGTTERVPVLAAVAPFEHGKKVVHVHSANGCEHLVTITAEGEIYTNGYNARCQLGHGHAEEGVTAPRLVSALSGRRVLRVACSYYHTLVATDDDEVFAFGRNDYGQCGLGAACEKEKNVCQPAELRFFRRKPTLALACGQYHSAVALAAGGVFTFGKNDFGQLGIGKQHRLLAAAGSAAEVRRWPVPVEGALRSKVATLLSGGYYHTGALCADGEVYMWGRNDYGQVGRPPGDERKQWQPEVLPSLTHHRALQVTCGCYHTLVLAETETRERAAARTAERAAAEKAVERAARTADAARGHVVPVSPPSASSAASSASSFAPAPATSVWAFGRNNHGQLGNGSTVDSHEPVRLTHLEGCFVGQVCAGFYHSLCLTGPLPSAPRGHLALPASSLSADLAAMLNSDERADLVLTCAGGRKLHAHWAMIAARSEPLERRLMRLETEQRQANGADSNLHADDGSDGGPVSHIELPHNHDVMLALLEYVYTDEVAAIGRQQVVNFEHALELLDLAKQFELAALAAKCERAIKRGMNAENVAEVLAMAEARQAGVLRKKCFDSCVYNFGQVMSSEAFSKLPQPLLHVSLRGLCACARTACTQQDLLSCTPFLALFRSFCMCRKFWRQLPSGGGRKLARVVCTHLSPG